VQISLDLANLPGGNYILRLSTNEGTLSQVFEVVK